MKPQAPGLSWHYAKTPVEWFAGVWIVYFVLLGVGYLNGVRWAAAEVAATISAGGGALLSLAAAAHALSPLRPELALSASSTSANGSVTTTIKLANIGTAAAPGVTVETVVRCPDGHCRVECSNSWSPQPEQALFGERRRQIWLASLQPGSAELLVLKHPECVGSLICFDMAGRSAAWRPSKTDFELMETAHMVLMWPKPGR